MNYLDTALQRMRCGVTISWENGYWIVHRPYNPACAWDTTELKTKSRDDALYFYNRWVDVALGPQPMTAEQWKRFTYAGCVPPPIGGDDRMESENEQTGLGITPGWWRPDSDRSHYD